MKRGSQGGEITDPFLGAAVEIAIDRALNWCEAVPRRASFLELALRTNSTERR